MITLLLALIDSIWKNGYDELYFATAVIDIAIIWLIREIVISIA